MPPTNQSPQNQTGQNQSGQMPPPPPPPGAPSLPPSQPEVLVKPSWQVQAMQKIWQQQGGSSQTQPLNPPSQPAAPPMYPPTSQGYDPYQRPSTPPPPSHYQQPQTGSKGGSSKWVIAIAALSVLIIAGAGALFYLLQPAPPDAGQIVSGMLNKSLQTSSYQEKLSVQSPNGTSTRTRQVDLRKLDEPRVHVDNMAPAGSQVQAEAIVVGKDYFVRRKVSSEELGKAKDETTKNVLSAANDEWVQVINDGAVINTPAVKALNLTEQLKTFRVIVPSPLLIGYFSDQNRQALSDLMGQSNIYTGTTTPVEETLGAETVWRQKVRVDQEGVRMINNQAARLLNMENPDLMNDALAEAVPEEMEFWVRQSDNRLLQYRYALGESTYTYSYDKIEENVTIDVPQLAPLAALTASDKDLQTAASEVAKVLSTYQQQGNVLPATASSFKELVEQRVKEDIRNNYTISLQNGTPKKGYIYYQPSHVCTSASGGFKKVSSPEAFAVVTGLTSSLFCTGEGK